jgi:hypothetical protein
VVAVGHENINGLVEQEEARQGPCLGCDRLSVECHHIAYFGWRGGQRHCTVHLHAALGHHPFSLAPAADASLLQINIQAHVSRR